MPLMPTLGAAFAIFAALSLASEASYLRAAEQLVSDEAAAASRLAWSATSPRVHSEPIHSALLDYLQATRVREWEGAAAASGDDPATAHAIARLERSVRAEAARPELGTPASTELLVSLDSVTNSRRARVAAASRDVPALYVVTLVVGGLALIVNSRRTHLPQQPADVTARSGRCECGRAEPGVALRTHRALEWTARREWASTRRHHRGPEVRLLRRRVLGGGRDQCADGEACSRPGRRPTTISKIDPWRQPGRQRMADQFGLTIRAEPLAIQLAC